MRWSEHGAAIGVTRSRRYFHRFSRHFFSANCLHIPLFRTSITFSGFDGATALQRIKAFAPVAIAVLFFNFN